MIAPIRDPSLWQRGAASITWAREHMPVTRTITAELAPTLAGQRIALVLVLEPKTAVLALALAEAGADVSVMCRAGTARDDTAAALAREGIAVFANTAATEAEDRELALALLDRRPDVLVDDGSSVTRLAHEARPDVVANLRGATEETTSGLRPLRVMERAGLLGTPVVAANDARTKTLFDNLHGTGQSTLFTTLDLLGTGIEGKHVVVAGFGNVGRGVARHAAAFGARVTVTEVDPVAALEAVFAGYEVAPLAEAARTADLVMSATGIAHTIDVDHLLALPEGAAVAVAGGVEQEIATAAAVAAGAVRSTVAPRVERFALPNGRGVLVLDDGGCINCTAGEGNPIEIMDLSFGVQASAIAHIIEHGPDLPHAVIPLPAAVDLRVARHKLASLALAIDAPSAAQDAFLTSWRTGRLG